MASMSSFSDSVSNDTTEFNDERLIQISDDDYSDSAERCQESNESDKFLSFAENGEVDNVREMLANNSKLIDAQDEDGYTALHRAAYNNHLQVAELLLSNGANPFARTVDGWHPLHSASKWGHVEMAALLVDSGSEINAKSNGGNTPLHLAASHKNGRRLLEFLLYNPNIDINIKNDAGDTAFEIARRSGRNADLWKYV